jgi:two-component system, NarL family, nitrate/nitrite response regulator NarL
MTSIRVFIVADDWLSRTGLATLLSEATGCESVGQSADSAQLAEDIDRTDPDLIVVDLGWNPEAAKLENALAVDLPVIALVPSEDDAQAMNAALMPAGEYGLLLRDSDPEQLSAAIGSVANGLVVIDPALVTAIMQQPPPQADPLLDPLTPRENEVLQLLARGLTNKAIAQRLEISEHTVKFHVNAVMGKLQAQSRTDAVIRATRLGLVLL